MALVGRNINSGSSRVTAGSLRGKTVSLNLKNCKWFLPPSQDPRLSLNAENPTIQIPEDASASDLKSLALKIKAQHIVVSDTPVPEFEKQLDVLSAHLNMVKASFPETAVIEHIRSIVIGVNLDGGYNKLEILEAMLEAEEVNPLTRKGGKNRPKIVAYLREAIEYVQRTYGGHSKVTKEDFTPLKESSLKSFPPAQIKPEKAKNILGIK